MERKEVTAQEALEVLQKGNRIDRVGDFENGILRLIDYSAVRKFKSIYRAIRRGHVSLYGEVYPHRPFKNHSPIKNKSNRIMRGYHAQCTGKATIW